VEERVHLCRYKKRRFYERKEKRIKEEKDKV
jgi:hypothetical protein